MRNRIIMLFLLVSFLVCVIALAFHVQTAKAATLMVPNNYATIQEAINNANDGDTILVKAGTYAEHVVINKTISLVGEDENTTIIDGNYTGTILTISCSSVNVTGFTMRNHGEEWFDSGVTIQNSMNCNVSGNVVITDTSSHPLAGESSQNMKVQDIPPPETYGILLDSSSNNYVVNNLIIEHVSRSFPPDPMEAAGKGIGLPMDSNGNFLVNNSVLSCDFEGIYLDWRSSRNTISGNRITNASFGITLSNSNNENLLTNNYIAYIHYTGIVVYYSSDNRLLNNTIISSNTGVWLEYNGGHILVGNKVTGGELGIEITQTHDNVIYHNEFANNSLQARAELLYQLWNNSWDDGYPSGGNYWSDYNGTDIYQGIYQNETGGDGIGDTLYFVDVNNVDRYPLIAPCTTFEVSTGSQSGTEVDVITNSTVSNIQIDEGLKTLSFNVSGANGTFGSCRIAIPNSVVKSLWQGNYTVLLNGEPWPFTNWTDSENTYIYINYTHSEHQIVIIPELSSILILPLFMTPTLLAIIVYRRKHTAYVKH